MNSPRIVHGLMQFNVASLHYLLLYWGSPIRRVWQEVSEFTQKIIMSCKQLRHLRFDLRNSEAFFLIPASINSQLMLVLALARRK
jgi:hypothetical protein